MNSIFSIIALLLIKMIISTELLNISNISNMIIVAANVNINSNNKSSDNNISTVISRNNLKKFKLKNYSQKMDKNITMDHLSSFPATKAISAASSFASNVTTIQLFQLSEAIMEENYLTFSQQKNNVIHNHEETFPHLIQKRTIIPTRTTINSNISLLQKDNETILNGPATEIINGTFPYNFKNNVGNVNDDTNTISTTQSSLISIENFNKSLSSVQLAAANNNSVKINYVKFSETKSQQQNNISLENSNEFVNQNYSAVDDYNQQEMVNVINGIGQMNDNKLDIQLVDDNSTTVTISTTTTAGTAIQLLENDLHSNKLNNISIPGYDNDLDEIYENVTEIMLSTNRIMEANILSLYDVTNDFTSTLQYDVDEFNKTSLMMVYEDDVNGDNKQLLRQHIQSNLSIETIEINNNNTNNISDISVISVRDDQIFETNQMATNSTTDTEKWPVKHSAIVEGDVILGGLMMVHSREDTITCGPIMPQGGIQALEAMLFTLDQINAINLLPNITVGVHILDDCDKDTYGLEMAVDFIKGE